MKVEIKGKDVRSALPTKGVKEEGKAGSRMKVAILERHSFLMVQFVYLEMFKDLRRILDR